MYKKTSYNTGQIGEFRVAAELARCGFTVALPTGSAPHIDILAYRSDIQMAIQVKATQHPTFQFNLNRFLQIECTDDGRQIVTGILPDLDEKVCMAFVVVGQEAGQDAFIWTSLTEFAELLAKAHKQYLEKHGGRRPGSNPKSMHSALTRKELQASFPSQTVDEYLASRR